MNFDLNTIPCFGVAGNFTGHLEQAGEALDFSRVKTLEANAPKAVFPTYIPKELASTQTPQFLTTFPFDAEKIIFPKEEDKIQIEPECALIFKTAWDGQKLVSLGPVAFGASNDVSIRKQGAKKISEKKNWGKSSKGFSNVNLSVDSFSEGSVLDNFRIASFLCRNGDVYEYGEDSAVKSYSYFYSKLTEWLLDKFNNQHDEGPMENINSYFNKNNLPQYIMVSVGATRYTEFGENNFLSRGDFSVVLVYDSRLYSHEDIMKTVLAKDFYLEGISPLVQEVF